MAAPEVEACNDGNDAVAETVMAQDAAEDAAELAEVAEMDKVNEDSKANLAAKLAGKLAKGKIDSKDEQEEAAELKDVAGMDCVNEDSKANLAALLGGGKKPVAEESSPVTDEELQEMKGKFHNLSVILEHLPMFDLIVTSPSALRIWVMGKTNKDWKPDPTQLDAGAKIQITEILKVDSISAKGWNEHSSYYLGCIGGNKWIRLINFRGVATVIPDIETFQGRVAGAVEKIVSMQQMVESEQQRRQATENRLLNAETRVLQMESARVAAETRVQELETAMKAQTELTAQKLEMATAQMELAAKESQEAGVLMRYFEKRMLDSETNRKQLDVNLAQTQETLEVVSSNLNMIEARSTELTAQLEESERVRAELERRLVTVSQEQTSEKKKVEKKDSKDKSKKDKKKSRKSTKRKQSAAE